MTPYWISPDHDYSWNRMGIYLFVKFIRET